ncbi:alpha/beta hydrolase [Filobacillus milosensis]|uniref:Alpha/beta hydrolase n=1 Tax=Filobacillus milosensis TaxID=94137 RepID=A0A4Y8IBZ1_9BACI|nr:alpha/beta hydrolase [Filobacillus milosensis]TFB13375.1 alpha/beta hydrolase [Filobacillus milosensis]
MNRDNQIIKINQKDIEFSILGEGEPILNLHGGHSNSNEEFGYESLITSGYQIITPSRPGYGRTSKEWNNLDQASQAYQAIINHLNLHKVHVIAVSAGGPSGIHFTSTYPELVQSLTLQSAVTKTWLTPKNFLFHMAKLMFNPVTEKFTWALTRRMNNWFPNFMFKQIAPSFTTLKKKELYSQILPTDVDEIRNMNNRYRSNHGFMLDLELPNQMKLDNLHNIKAPTLIIHSSNDGSVPLDHPLFAHQNITNSRLETIDTWGHLIWIGEGSEEAHQLQVDFLKENSLNTLSQKN